MEIKIEHTGNALAGLGSALDRCIEKAVTEGALLVEHDAKVKVPVDTGNLRASIHTTPKGKTAEVGTNVEYAPHVEYGTRHKAARPFLYPSLVDNKQNITKIFDKAITDAMKAGGTK